MRRTSPFLEPFEHIEPAPPLSSAIKRRYAPEANPEPYPINHFNQGVFSRLTGKQKQYLKALAVQPSV